MMRVPFAAVPIAAATLMLLTACGGGPAAATGGGSGNGGANTAATGAAGNSGPGVSAHGSAPPAFTIPYSACMRSHGITNFPDPDARGNLRIPANIDTRSARYKAAVTACQREQSAGQGNTNYGAGGNGPGSAPTAAGNGGPG